MPSVRNWFALTLVVSLVWVGDIFAGPFTPGNVVVYRLGKGDEPLVSSGAAVFLDEYTPAGVLVHSHDLPTTGEGVRLIADGLASSEGLLTQSTNRQYLLLTGYDRDIGGSGALSGSASSAVPRVIGRIDITTGEYIRTNALTDVSNLNSVRSVASDDGNRFWVTGGAGGIRFVAQVGDATSTQLSTTVTSLRQTHIFDGQLYVSSNAGSIRLATVGTGLPTTSGQTITNLNGFPTTGSQYGFFIADLDAAVAGVDTLYVADDNGSGVGRLKKYSLVDGTWTENGIVGDAADAYRGLTAVVIGSTVTLYATRKGGNDADGGGELVKLIDTSGYNQNFSSSDFTVLSTAATNSAFRGVVYVAAIPEPGALALGGLTLLLGCGICWRRGRSRNV